MAEQWRDIAGYGIYQVSDLGQVRNRASSRIMSSAWSFTCFVLPLFWSPLTDPGKVSFVLANGARSICCARSRSVSGSKSLSLAFRFLTFAWVFDAVPQLLDAPTAPHDYSVPCRPSSPRPFGSSHLCGTSS